MKIEPIRHEPTRWTVHSEKRKDTAFIIDSDYTSPGGTRGWACGCEDHMARGRECKHIRAVRQLWPAGRHFDGGN